MRKQKFQYQTELKEDFPNIKTVDNEFDNPKNLYKYYAINEKNVSAFISQKLFVSSPDQLNDLFDTLFLRVKVEKEHLNLFKEMMQKVDLELDEKEFLNSIQYRIKLRNSFFAIWNSKFGILSTTDDPYNDLMWAHYTNNEGFTIEIDSSKLPDNFGKSIPISYLESKEFEDYDSLNLLEQIVNNSLLKKNLWKYENEYRFLVFPKQYKSFLTSGRFSNEDHSDYHKESRLQDYPKGCITKLTLGFNFFKSFYSENSMVDFGKPGGLIRKVLLDYAIKESMIIELLWIDHNKMSFVPYKIDIVAENEMLYKIAFINKDE